MGGPMVQGISEGQIAAAASRALDRCHQLAARSTVSGSVTRLFLTPPMHEVHTLFRTWAEAAGLSVRVDAIGNIFARSHLGSFQRRLMVGSHLDTVPDAGRYDGVLGVMLGLAAAECISEMNAAPTCGLEVVGFSEEEGVRFDKPYLGSLAVAGCFDVADLALIDREGVSLESAIKDFGLDPRRIPGAACDPAELAGYLEVHIEQGPVLEARDAPLGVVTGIAGQSRRTLRFTGSAAHAGTCPMDLRKDALAAAAEFITAVESDARHTQALVATVGALAIEPNASNVVPGEATLSLDVRHERNDVREEVLEKLLARAQRISAARAIGFSVTAHTDHPAVSMNTGIQDAFSKAVAHRGLPHHRMVSGAGHDAAIMARICPSGMLFIRSPGGISHHPDESVRTNDVAHALAVLIDTVLDLSERSRS